MTPITYAQIPMLNVSRLANLGWPEVNDGWRTKTKVPATIPMSARSADTAKNDFWPIRLLPAKESDAQEIADFVIDDRFFYSLLNPTIYDRYQAAEAIVTSDPKTSVVKTIRHLHTDELLGCISLVDIKKIKNAKSAEIRYFIKAPAQGKRLGTQAIMRMLGWGIDALNLKNIIATTDPLNARSHLILLNAGFQQQRFIPDHESPYYDINGKKSPRLFMKATRSEIQKNLKLMQRIGKYSPKTEVA